MTLGYGVYQNDHEDANGQFEVNWRFDDALLPRRTRSRSSSSPSRRWPSSAACWRPSCPSRSPTSPAMARTRTSRCGTPRVKDNLFLDKSDPRGLSSVALSFLGGLLDHAPALCALTAPFGQLLQALRRALARGLGATWAPVFIAHGGNNRTMMVRVPAPGRLEYRTADGSCKPLSRNGGPAGGGAGRRSRGASKSARGAGRQPVPAFAQRQAKERGIGFPARRTLGMSLDALEQDEVLRRAHRRGLRGALFGGQAGRVGRVRRDDRPRT